MKGPLHDDEEITVTGEVLAELEHERSSDEEEPILRGEDAEHDAESSGDVVPQTPPRRRLSESSVRRGSLRRLRAEHNRKETRKTVAWKDLPQKGQLIVITLVRLSEPLVQTSLQSYMFYQLKWFDPSLPDSTISSQAGILHASFTAAQFLTAMVWGRVADSSVFGRKSVVITGLLGTSE